MIKLIKDSLDKKNIIKVLKNPFIIKKFLKLNYCAPIWILKIFII